MLKKFITFALALLLMFPVMDASWTANAADGVPSDNAASKKVDFEPGFELDLEEGFEDEGIEFPSAEVVEFNPVDIAEIANAEIEAFNANFVGTIAYAAKFVTLREEPRDTAWSSGFVSGESTVTIIRRQNNWLYVVGENSSGRQIEGWAPANQFSEVQLTAVNTAASALRTGAGATFRSLRTVPVGTSMRVLRQSQNGNWLRVNVGGRVGWMRERDVRQSATMALVTNASAVLRERPSATATRVSSRNRTRNDQLNVFGRNSSGNWLLVNDGIWTGWVQNAHVRVVRMPATVTASTTRLRRDARSNATSIRTLNRNTNMTVLGAIRNGRNTWLHVRVGSRNGWVLERNTANVRNRDIVSFIGQPARVKSSGAAFRRSPSNNGTRIRTIRSGTRVQVLATQGSWRYVQPLGSRTTGWVRASQINQSAFNARLRWQERSFHREPNLSSTRIRTLAANTQVRVLSYHGNWTRVRVGNTTGWILFPTFR